jgi:hypothetical protein
MQTPPAVFKPLVIGAPRSGFSLLTSVLIQFADRLPRKEDLRQRLVNLVIGELGDTVSDAICKTLKTEGYDQDVIFNENFRLLLGGPKWLDIEHPDRACIRKYIGVRGIGDFTLVIALPKQALDFDTIVHSHESPDLWPGDSCYGGHLRYASIRNPIGMINSSMFSLNALTSEYMQRHLPPGIDQTAIRRDLALYKFTDMKFFEGIARHYQGYLGTYLEFRESYHEMRWEKLVTQPTETICGLADHAGIDIDEEKANAIWSRMSDRNLTGAHMHNYRPGAGRPDDWMDTITNKHLSVLRVMGFDPILKSLGYQPIPTLDESGYTEFQDTVSQMLERDHVFDDFPDRALFRFAFNKSNIDSSDFQFKRYPWRRWTQVERSDFPDERLLMRVWDSAEDAVGALGGLLEDLLAIDYEDVIRLPAHVGSLRKRHAASFRDHGDSFGKVMEHARALCGTAQSAAEAAPQISRWRRMLGMREKPTETAPPIPPEGDSPPRLVRTLDRHNIVEFRRWYYAVPHAVGAIDFAGAETLAIPGVTCDISYQRVESHLLAAEQSGSD